MSDDRIRVLDTSDDGSPGEIIALAANFLASGVPVALSDDRFSAGWQQGVSQGRTVAIVVEGDDGPSAFAVGQVVPGDTVAVEVLVSLDADDRALQAHNAVAAWLSAVNPESTVEVWIKPEIGGLDLADLGLVRYRRLHQMRVPLPVPAAIETIETRAFVPGDDDEAVVRTNNRAFLNHPVQGTLTLDQFREEMASEWFRAEGLRIAEIDGRMAGFCWTKIHPETEGRPALAEIYVICVDPDFHGRGLGRPMTGAGLDWLIAQGLDLGMLYVEADNTPAIRTYEGMGFTVVRSDSAWHTES